MDSVSLDFRKQKMKKIMMLALVIMAGATFCPANAGKKDKKKKKENTQVVVEPVVPTNNIDSLSYALGIEMTNGLMPYLVEQLGVDTAYMPKFIEGFRAAIAKDKDNKETIAFSAGVNFAKMVSKQLPNVRRSFTNVVDSLNEDMVNEGFLASLNKDKTVFDQTTASAYVTGTREAYVKGLQKKGEDYLAENAKREGVVTLPSGLQYKVLREGNGPVATKSDEVEVKYEGRLIDGTIFDSSYERSEQTMKFRPTQVIIGWTEALTMMPEGSMWELYIPQNLAYGERQHGKIPPYSTLIFKVELEKVNKASVPVETKVTTVPAEKDKTAKKTTTKGKTTTKKK